jgi:ribose transport system ATP-binding protein
MRSPVPTGATPVFELRGVSKSFGGVAALEGADLVLHAGEVHALIGENGAGKSTLINVATGVYQPDRGTVLVDGSPVHLSSPRFAAERGISVVHQERNLVGAFSVAENLFLGRVPRTGGLVSYRRMVAESRPWLEQVGLDLDPLVGARQLSPGQAQLLEIAKALAQRCQVLLLDEPTSSITEGESEHLFTILRDLRDQGTAIVFVSHKLEEVYALCDRVTVLRDGRNVVTGRPLGEVTREEVVYAMVGRPVDAAGTHDHHEPTGPVRLELDAVSTEYGHQNVSLSVHAGEIVGLYGLVGAGRTELARSVVGLGKITAGTLRIDGQPARIRNPYDALRHHGVGYVSEDRKAEGLILQHSIGRNVGITVWDKVRHRLGWLSEPRARAAVEQPVDRLRVKMQGLSQPVSGLSGGNQQKVSAAKWLAAEAGILLFDEPTVGIDVAAKEEMHQLLRELARKGAAILLISSDLREVIRLADRILVMGSFRLLGEVESTGDYPSVSRAVMERITSSVAAGPGPSPEASRA